MQIKTKEFQLTKGEYFKIITSNYFRKKWWLFILLFLIAGLLWFLGAPYLSLFIILFTIIYFFFLIIFFWLYAISKANSIFFRKRFYEIDDNFIIGHLEDGSLQKTNLNNIIKVIRTTLYYLLYISTTQFFFVPLSAFTSEEDLKNFESLMKTKNLL